MKVSVLVAENDIKQSAYSRQVLRRFGFSVTVCNEPGQTARALESHGRKHRFECVWMDLNFRDDRTIDFRDDSRVDGLSLLAQSKQDQHDCPPALIYSGFINDDARDKADRLQINDTIYDWYGKPFDAELVAFDTLQAANTYLWRRCLNELRASLGQQPPAVAEYTRNVIATSEAWAPLVPRNRKLLIGKLRRLLDGLESTIQRDSEGGAREHVERLHFLTGRHLHLYVETAGRNHQALADHVAYVVDRGKSSDLLFSLKASSALRRAIECIGKERLGDDELFTIKERLEKAIDLPLGPVLGRDEGDLLDYLSTVYRNSRREH